MTTLAQRIELPRVKLNPVETAPSLDSLADAIRREHAAAQEGLALAKEHGRASVQHAIHCGELLRQAKKSVGHGAWRLWLQEHIGFSARTATGYMQLAGLPVAKRQRVAELPLREALKTIGNKPDKSSCVEYYSPSNVIEAAVRVLGPIDLDPASCREANATVQANRYYDREQDGLKQIWRGTVWLNPPYGGDAGAFVAKLLAEYRAGHVTAAIVALNSHCTDAGWFQPLFEYLLCFTAGRIKYHNPRHKGSHPPHGTVFVYLGPDPDRFAQKFSCFGHVVAPYRPTRKLDKSHGSYQTTKPVHSEPQKDRRPQNRRN